jgi:predicted CoA-binding protein
LGRSINEAAAAFLACRRVAVTGVSRTPKTHGSNNVYRRLRERVEAVVIGTRPEIAEDTMRECADLGIKQVWMHRGPGAGSVSGAATSYGRQHGITVIDGGCPLMFGPTADFGHKIMRLVYAGHVPKQV